MMSAEIRQVVRVDGRNLHLRRLGSGPAIMLLHESPRSSAVLMPLAQALAPRFTVFALDTPGFGLSDPLPLARPNVEDFADALAASLAALGLTRFAVYGVHTGAAIAVTMAARHPTVVTGAILDGYPLFTGAESDALAYHYLPQFEPSWDGAHVARLWSRVRDQYSFFPWNAPGRGSRLRRGPPTPQLHTEVIRDFLASGRHYAAGYESAFRFDAAAALQRAAVPVHVTCREDDLLFPHLDRLPPLPAHITIARLSSDRGEWARHIADVAAGMAGGEAPPPRFGAMPEPGGALSALSGGVLARCYGSGENAALPLLLLPELPGSASGWDEVARREAKRRLVVAVEPPGLGISPACAAGASPADAALDAILAALAHCDIDRFDLGGRGAGALLAARLAARNRASVGRLLLLDPPPAGVDAAALAEEREPDWHGGHLMAAWYEARDRMLYRPWSRRDSAAQREIGPGIDIGAVQAHFTALVRSGNGHLPLLRDLSAQPAGLTGQGFAETQVVLQAGDHDGPVFAQALSQAGAKVSSAHYDDLAGAAAAALGCP